MVFRDIGPKIATVNSAYIEMDNLLPKRKLGQPFLGCQCNLVEFSSMRHRNVRKLTNFEGIDSCASL